MKAWKVGLFAVVASVVVMMSATAGGEGVAKWDVRMALEKARVDTNGLKWISGEYLPIEGKAYANTARYFDRLPATVTTNVNGGVRGLLHMTAGMQFRFMTDSRRLRFRWTNNFWEMDMVHMPATGVSCIDVYRQEQTGKWCFVKTCFVDRKTRKGDVEIPWMPGTPCLVNLPLYNGLEDFLLGIEERANIAALPPRKSGIDKPVVFYGTSITHGGCASRPGMSFVNIVGRRLDVPVVNLGFSGSGRMELEMSEHLATIDASCYVLDCLPNMDDRLVSERYEPFIRNLRRKRPNVPIVMAEHCEALYPEKKGMDRLIAALYGKLKKEGWKNLVYLPKEGMLGSDTEGTVDGCHPNDYGMMLMAHAFGNAVAEAIGLKFKNKKRKE